MDTLSTGLPACLGMLLPCLSGGQCPGTPQPPRMRRWHARGTPREFEPKGQSPRMFRPPARPRVRMTPSLPAARSCGAPPGGSPRARKAAWGRRRAVRVASGQVCWAGSCLPGARGKGVWGVYGPLCPLIRGCSRALGAVPLHGEPMPAATQGPGAGERGIAVPAVPSGGARADGCRARDARRVPGRGLLRGWIAPHAAVPLHGEPMPATARGSGAGAVRGSA